MRITLALLMTIAAMIGCAPGRAPARAGGAVGGATGLRGGELEREIDALEREFTDYHFRRNWFTNQFDRTWWERWSREDRAAIERRLRHIRELALSRLTNDREAHVALTRATRELEILHLFNEWRRHHPGRDPNYPVD